MLIKTSKQKHVQSKHIHVTVPFYITVLTREDLLPGDNYITTARKNC